MKTINSIKQLGISHKDRILICMPHPDDEAVFSSGLIMQLTRRNIAVELTTFTLGEVSTLRHGLAPDDDLASVRKHELSAAVKILGLSHHNHLDFGDGRLKYKSTKMRSWISNKVKESGITTIVTLEPDGIYGHPDHIALTTSCKQVAKTRKLNLIYVTVKPNFTQPSARHMAEKDTIQPINPQYELKLTFSDMLTKIRAMSAHSSQLKFTLKKYKTYLFLWKNRMLTHEYFAHQA